MTLLKEGSFEKVAEETVEYFYSIAAATGTLWEFDSTFASLTHSFASYVIVMLIEIYCGNSGISPRNKQIILTEREQLVSRDFMVSIPTNDGAIVVKSQKKTISIELPKGWRTVLRKR